MISYSDIDVEVGDLQILTWKEKLKPDSEFDGGNEIGQVYMVNGEGGIEDFHQRDSLRYPKHHGF